MNNRILSILLFSFILLMSCNGNKGKNGQGGTNDSQVQSKDASYLKLITIKKGDQIQIDNPRVFIEIGILFNHVQQEWVEQIHKNTNMNSEEYLNKQRENFYSSYGINETDIAIYNQNHYQEIEAFLNENPEFRQAYLDSSGDQFIENY